jgi:DNA-directed RNA polymerase specialized sigma24 family protein
MATRLHQATRKNATILDAARDGDSAAWDEIVRRFQGLVRATVGTYRLNHADAADAIQITWLRLFEHAQPFATPKCPVAG